MAGPKTRGATGCAGAARAALLIRRGACNRYLIKGLLLIVVGERLRPRIRLNLRDDLLILNVNDVDKAALDDGLSHRCFGGTLRRLLIIAHLLWLILLLVDDLVGEKVPL